MRIPKKFQKYFWDAPVETLQWQEHKYFIISRFLNRGSMEALRWLERNYHFMASMPDFLSSTHARKLTKRTINFWKQYFGMEELPWETATYKRLRESCWID